MSTEPRPFAVSANYLEDHLEEMVDSVFSDLKSEFLILPKGPSFIDYRGFQSAYEVLKRHTMAFERFTEATLWDALREDALAFLVLRTILGLSPPEWADLARSERGSIIPQGFVRKLDVDCRLDREPFARQGNRRTTAWTTRVEALVSVAVEYINQGAPDLSVISVHRLEKVDTAEGLISLQHVAAHGVPYAMLLYERYLGRPFASHRDSVSELVGDVMESAIEERLADAHISARKTKRAERIPGFDQAPDFVVPDEFNPAIVIEAKITNDDGTARDKATRIVHLAELRDQRARQGQPSFEVVACIDGRGFGVRREDMRRILLQTHGKVFTLATLDQLIQHTRLNEFVPKAG